MPSRLGRVIAPVVAFAALAVVWTFPLALHVADRLPGAVAGDNVSFLWNLWWMRESGTAFFRTPLLFAPFGADLALHTHTAAQGLIAATVLRPLDIVLAQNVIILATLTLNGVAAYLLALDRTGSRPGALVAGLAFAGSPYVSAHLLGHFSLVSVWTLPLFALCWVRALERRSIGWATTTGLCFVAVTYTDYYYAVYCVVIGGALLVGHTRLVRVTTDPRPLAPRTTWLLASAMAALIALVAAILLTGGIDRMVLGVRVQATEPGHLLTASWIVVFALPWLRLRPRLLVRPDEDVSVALRGVVRLLVPVVLVAGVGAAPLLVHVVRLWMSGDYAAPAYFWRSGPRGIDLASFVLGNPLHPMTGASTHAAYERLGLDPVEGVGWLGLVLTAALAWGGVQAVRSRRLPWTLAGGSFFLVWALGPWLMIGGTNLGLVLPANLFALVPVLSNARMPGRAIVVTLLAASLLLARYIAGVAPERRTQVATLLALLLLIDFVPAPFPLTELSTPALYRAIPRVERGAVLELPVGIRDGFEQIGSFNDRTLRHQMLHGHPLVGGFAARVAPSIKEGYARMPLVRSFLRLSDGAGDGADARDVGLDRAAAVAAFQAASIRFVVVDTATASADLMAFVARLPLTAVAQDGRRQLYRVDE
jgi:hypothetical protein